MKAKNKVDKRMLELKEVQAEEMRLYIKSRSIDKEYGLELALDEAYQINFHSNNYKRC